MKKLYGTIVKRSLIVKLKETIMDSKYNKEYNDFHDIKSEFIDIMEGSLSDNEKTYHFNIGENTIEDTIARNNQLKSLTSRLVKTFDSQQGVNGVINENPALKESYDNFVVQLKLIDPEAGNAFLFLMEDLYVATGMNKETK